MVKLKIRSADDIVAANLSCLGIKKNEASYMLEAYPELEKSADITTEIDEIIYRKAKKIFKAKLAKAQLIALYKAEFIGLNSARKYGIKPLLPDFDDEKFNAEMQMAYIEVAPSYKITDMPTQEITTMHLHKVKSEGEKK